MIYACSEFDSRSACSCGETHDLVLETKISCATNKNHVVGVVRARVDVDIDRRRDPGKSLSHGQLACASARAHHARRTAWHAAALRRIMPRMHAAPIRIDRGAGRHGRRHRRHALARACSFK